MHLQNHALTKLWLAYLLTSVSSDAKSISSPEVDLDAWVFSIINKKYLPPLFQSAMKGKFIKDKVLKKANRIKH